MILVVGGAGYIGSHVVKQLVETKPVVVLDNLSTGHRYLVDKKALFVHGDLGDRATLVRIFEKYPIDAVMHFAANSLVGESVAEPMKYYKNNVAATLTLLETMMEYGVKRFIFSSTAAVYGIPNVDVITEQCPTNPINPYGRSKLMIEHMLSDFASAYDLRYVVLRYFNAAGAHESGEIGEDHHPETHLIPLILQHLLDLPDKLEQKEYCPLTVEQASLYEQIVQQSLEKLEQVDGFARRGIILQMLNSLKQLCNHPALYLKEKHPKQIVERSHKVEKLLELVKQIRENGESCLIFTQYIQMGEMIQHLLSTHLKETVVFLNGSTPKQTRDEMIEQFQNGQFHIFILSLKAGGTGLNLTAANHVIHFDRWWNPAVENQATDRAYRIGQTKFVHVHKFITTGTIEEKIDNMLEKKQALNEQLIQSETWITELSNEQLRELFTLS